MAKAQSGTNKINGRMANKRKCINENKMKMKMQREAKLGKSKYEVRDKSKQTNQPKTEVKLL